jgi:hypothetical protein
MILHYNIVMGVVILQKRIICTLVLISLIFSTVLSIVVNAGNLGINKSFSTTRSKTFENYDMIIIAPSIYESALEPFIEHKNNRDIISKFVKLEDIYSGIYFEVQGRDDQEQIKYFIKDALETWLITYTLFVGSYKQVPVRYCYNNDNYSNSPEPKFISELYYADIYNDTGEFSSWDTNEDGIYGTWDGDVAEDKPINLTPDICLGRLACIDVGEVTTVVNKIINYENQPADPSWFKRMVMVGGDTYQEFEGFEGEENNQRAIDSMDESFIPIKLWASNGKLKKEGWNIIGEINKGAGFWYLSGHGNTNIWVTYSADHIKLGRLTSYIFLLLLNKNKLPVTIVGGCHNSEFAIPTQIKSWNPFRWLKECFSWQLVSKPNGGSIATIGATGLSWYGIEFGGGGTDWLNVQLFKEFSNDEKILGQIWKNAITKYLDEFPIDWKTPSGEISSIDAKSVQEWTLLGDPSLTIGGGTEEVVNRKL